METLLPPPSTNGHTPFVPNLDSLTSNPQPTFPHTNGGRIKEGGGGPKTAAGKAQSRLNALKHTLTACDEVFLTGLDEGRRTAYMNLRMMLRRHYRPATEMERLLVDRIAVNQFRILCLCRIESRAMTTTPDNLLHNSSVVPHLDRFSCYDTRLERQNRTLHNRLVQLFENRGVTCHKPFPYQE